MTSLLLAAVVLDSLLPSHEYVATSSGYCKITSFYEMLCSFQSVSKFPILLAQDLLLPEDTCLHLM